MRILFHIGMGKTGTSSIQLALKQNKPALSAARASYLGMWFDIVDDRFDRAAGFNAFCQEPPSALRLHAKQFAEKMRQGGQDIYIHSNEGIFGQVERLLPFFKMLIDEEELDVRFVAYMRPPHDWLPSAFTQWIIRHKQQEGPIQTFRERAPALIGVYSAARIWKENFGDRFEARLFDKSIDVVSDFGEYIGVALKAPTKRSLERSAPAETVMRALFNDRFEPAVMPEHFNRTVMHNHSRPPHNLDDMIKRSLNYDGLNEIVSDHLHFFDYIREDLGVNLRADEEIPAPKPVDTEAVRHQILDYVVFVLLEQSLQIHRLKRDLAEIKGEDTTTLAAAPKLDVKQQQQRRKA